MLSFISPFHSLEDLESPSTDLYRLGACVASSLALPRHREAESAIETLRRFCHRALLGIQPEVPTKLEDCGGAIVIIMIIIIVVVVVVVVVFVFVFALGGGHSLLIFCAFNPKKITSKSDSVATASTKTHNLSATVPAYGAYGFWDFDLPWVARTLSCNFLAKPSMMQRQGVFPVDLAPKERKASWWQICLAWLVGGLVHHEYLERTWVRTSFLSDFMGGR